MDGLPSFAAASMMGSILPGAWSFMLAARERGLGTAWTTIHMMFEKEAAEVLGIDYDNYTQCALITCGYSEGHRLQAGQAPADRDHPPLGRLAGPGPVGLIGTAPWV